MKLAKSVLRQIEKDFAPEHREALIAALRNTSLPLIGSNEERVHLSIVLLSKGDQEIFTRNLSQAKKDWRDTLMDADLAGSNWREVAKRLGAELD